MQAFNFVFKLKMRTNKWR